MDPALIGSIFAGVTGVLTVLTGYALNKRKVETEQVSRDIGDLTSEVEDMRTRLDVALRHIYELRGVMTAAQIAVPELPDELQTRRTRRNTA
ncbi:hypothetical protein [Saccharopolyspora spinosa]|uniref:Uncharacterized protein n=1 Tax=Saccharopolyspora spinosa TaxID=60894 RepID=A0A2N3XZ08_SACSN|nr:hypothetical protein [Saccharopolyspora spinosa]PKW15914.1 hypothetical protein A8926_3696 [Saccharopolyspora spinosa]